MAIRVSGLNSGLDTEAIVSALVSSYSVKKTKIEKSQTKLSWKQDAWKDANAKIYSLYTSLDNFRYEKSYNLKKASISDATKATISASNDAFTGSQKLEITQVAQTGFMTGGILKTVAAEGEEAPKLTSDTKLSELGFTGETATISITIGSGENAKTEEIEVTKDMTLSELTGKLSEKGVKASFDSAQQRLYLNAKESGAAGDFTLGGDATLLAKLGLDAASAKKIGGQDAKIKLNDVEYTSNTGSFSINGINIQALNKTEGAININVQNDTQGLYDKIKEFFSNYNSVINELQSLYNAESAKGYEPLSEEEKDAMSDTQVEKWEKKIKDSILRRDTTLGTIINTMTVAMQKSFSVGDENVSLGTFGIQTLGFLNAKENEQYAYHIAGDADDEDSSSKTDKLMKALNEDPDKVASFFSQLTQNLYTELDAKMKSTNMSSAYKVYNDKEMASEYSDYTKQIKKWDEKLHDMEDRYFKQFTAMEKALAQLNSSSSALTGMIGQ
ncbi:flagellar hook-associated protein 2 [Lachnospiraceae bacterium XBD2001]|nr:flagellar hook-associated protein 2 [Lachnospiraceae bacterium XBD2001]